jgi:Caspase domain
MSDEGGRHALVVAVSRYRDPKLRRLRAPAADAKRLAAVLQDPNVGGFDVEVALDENEAPLRRRIARFFSGRRPDDLLLVHFSCHGIKDERGDLYLAAADTEVGDLLGATGVSSSWLSEQVGRSRSRRVVLLLDCCFSGSFPFGVRARATDTVDAQHQLEGRGRAVITASNAMEYAYEGDQLTGHGEPSIFTEAVVEGLASGDADRDGDGLISVDELYDYVFDRVKERTPNQTPNKLSTLEGALHIARSQARPPAAEQPEAPQAATPERPAATSTDWWDRYGWTVGVLAATAVGSFVGGLVSWPIFKPGPVGRHHVFDYFVLMAPATLALVCAMLASGRVRRDWLLAATAVFAGAAIGALAGFVSLTTATPPRSYFVITSAIAGAGLGLSCALPTRRMRLTAIAILAGMVGGVVAGLVEPANRDGIDLAFAAAVVNAISLAPALALVALAIDGRLDRL